MSVYAALRWSFLGELASRAIPPIVFIVLARLLTPEDYGVVAAATMVISFTQIFWEAGLAKAIIQYQGDRTTAADTAFWINNGLGLFVAAALFVGAKPIADGVFHDPRVAPVLQVMVLQVLLSAAASVHNALLMKDMKFQHLFWIKIATIAAPALAAVPLAVYGFGYWALVAGTLAGKFIQVLFLWTTNPWKPAFSFDPAIAIRLGHFGGWVALSGLLAWFFHWADSLIVGSFLGSHQLGFYRTGNAFVATIFAGLFGPLMPVLYSHLSSAASNHSLVRETMIRLQKTLAFVSFPLGMILAFNAQLIAEWVFGTKWQGIELVIAPMSLLYGFSWIVGANFEAFRAVGLPSVETKIMAAAVVLYVVGYLVSIRYGFETFVWTRFGLEMIVTGIHFWAMKKIFNVAPAPILGYALTIAAICFVGIGSVALVSAKMSLDQSVSAFITVVVVGLLLLSYERKGLVPQLYAIVRRGLGLR